MRDHSTRSLTNKTTARPMHRRAPERQQHDQDDTNNLNAGAAKTKGVEANAFHIAGLVAYHKRLGTMLVMKCQA